MGDLPIKCNILLGHDWLERFGYQFRILELGINLPAYSETLVRIPTVQIGSRLLETGITREHILCFKCNRICRLFIRLVINCNQTDKILRKFHRTQELPTLSKFLNAKGKELHAWNQVLEAQLRLAHVKEGEQELRQICAEYSDVFKLPGDRWTVTSAVKQYIPNPTIRANRSITFQNYRIPEHHLKEVDTQIKQMLEDMII
jgi:hypothetical protein